MKTVVIVGGGITGLSTAYYLEREAREKGLHLRLILVEAENRLGGIIKTERRDGYVIEMGPDSFLQRKPGAVKLIRNLGIAHELVGTNPRRRKTYILKHMKLHRIPQGLNIGVPTQFMPFATTTLLSMGGKLRAGLDLFLPRSPHQGDQSLGAFLERRLGTEVVDNMAEPLLAGIYAGDLRKLSLRATFPQFEQLEKKHGSLIRGMLMQAKEAADAKRSAQTTPQPEYGANALPPLPESAFLTFPTGLERLIEAVSEALQMTDVRLNTRVEKIEPREGGGYDVRIVDGETIEADAVVLTPLTYQAAQILPASFAENSHLMQVPHASVATCVLAFEAGQLDHDLDGTGFVIPKSEPTTITACTWTSSKWEHAAQDGRTLIRCYVGRAGQEGVVDLSDDEIIAKVRQDLEKIMGITAEPAFTLVNRWRRAMPQYLVGHLDRVRDFFADVEQELPGLFFAGSGYHSMGIPDLITQGEKLAGTLHDYLAD